MLLDEIDIHLSLDHPNVVRLDSAYEDEDALHIVLEHLEGGNMAERAAEQGRHSEPEAALTLRQMLRAIAYLHARRIAHRDLKLENFCCEGGSSKHLKLIDFGLSARWASGSQGGGAPTMTRACGSHPYVAPEVLSQCYTEKADIWSMGVIAYVLLCDEFPWTDSESHAKQQILAGRPKYSEKLFMPLPSDCRDFVRMFLRLDPARRPSAKVALEHGWLFRHDSKSSLSVSVDTLQRLQSFSSMPAGRRKCFAMWARMLRPGEDTDFRDNFMALGGSKAAGTIANQDWLRALKALGVDRTEASELFSSLDANKDGEIEYSEFLAAVLPRNSTSAFAHFDVVDGSTDDCHFSQVLEVDTVQTVELLRRAQSNDRVVSRAEAHSSTRLLGRELTLRVAASDGLKAFPADAPVRRCTEPESVQTSLTWRSIASSALWLIWCV